MGMVVAHQIPGRVCECPDCGQEARQVAVLMVDSEGKSEPRWDEVCSWCFERRTHPDP